MSAGTLDISSLLKTIESDGEVNLPPEILARKRESKILKGELRKPVDELERIDAKLEKIEKRTDFLIEKSNKKNASSEKPQPVAKEKKLIQREKKVASLADFYCLKGLPKIILKYIHQNTYFDNAIDAWVAIVCTEELKNLSGKKTHHLKIQMLRLQNQGWFSVLRSSNSGTRLVRVNKESFPLT